MKSIIAIGLLDNFNRTGHNREVLNILGSDYNLHPFFLEGTFLLIFALTGTNILNESWIGSPEKREPSAHSA